MGKELPKDAIKELKDEVLKTNDVPFTEHKKIIFDGRQYSIRFPRHFIEEADIDINKDYFEVVLTVPEMPQKPTIKAELRRG